MSKKTNGVNYAKSPLHTNRRVNALKRLECQLVINKKFINDENGKIVSIDLVEKDIKRINAEIQILKSRI